MPDDVDSPYAHDWSAGAFAPPGVIWLGEIPLDRARELVDQGWQVVGQPLPPFASTDEIDPANVNVTPHNPPATDTDVDAVQGAGPPVHVEPGPPDQGGPEDVRAPPDFDIPLPSEPPPAQLPTTVPREVIGELPDYSMRPGMGRMMSDLGEFPPLQRSRVPAPRIWEGEILKRGARRAGRVLGPLGGIIDLGFPESLGSGELPFPPVPQVDTTPDLPPLELPSFPDLPAPEVPQVSRPEVPEVIEVTAPAPTPFPLPRSSSTLPRVIGGLLGGLTGLSILRPKHRSPTAPSASPSNFSQPEVNVPTPLPRTITDPLTPPWPTPGTDPLTPPRDVSIPSPQPSPFGAPQGFSAPTAQDEDNRCRCKKCKKCEDRKKRKPDPSDTVADVKEYKRRMSRRSLKNLNRGTVAARPRRSK